ncbi:MAG TPA: hypothetical protein VF817_02395 [Patescibacteria group bacterium]
MRKDNLNSNKELTWTFLDGSSRTAGILETVAIGKGEYLPGWQWSKHAGKITGKESERHIGYILSGEMMVKDSGGNEARVVPGEAFEVGPGHDAWVLGNVSCIALDFTYLGKEK